MDMITADTKSSYDKRCAECFLRGYLRLFKKFDVDEDKQKSFMKIFEQNISELRFFSAPMIQRELNKDFRDIIGIEDPFLSEKKQSNIQAFEIYKRWKPIVFETHDSFKASLRLAIAGNIMDYGAADSFDIDSVIINVLHADFAIDDSCLLKERIQKANKILYLGDNAGEIVFDKLFIETNLSDKVTYVVKSAPVLNDVTMQDAVDTNMHETATVITNGYDAPSTVLSKCSREFMDEYNSSDLIISKGQGNLEGLLKENDDRIFFLLMVKCDVIADLLNVEKGSFVVLNGGKNIDR
ncbi:MAG: ARMT1-like domain-containing protein [Bacteroidales bacterium]|nr:ARMT1-like domain-containing protein [Bacteroidales bacterium]